MTQIIKFEKPNTLLHFFVTSVFMVLFTFSIRSQNIEWNENYRLKYEDFIAHPPYSKYEQKAETYSVIEVKFSQNKDIVQAEIISYFKKDASWMRDESKNDYTLRHEQGHFDITELYARKLRKKFKGMTLSRKNAEKKIKKICKKYIHQHLKKQKEYDKATSFSIRENNQRKWTEKIEAELKNMSAYSDRHLLLKMK